jgi:hypothetical protein
MNHPLRFAGMNHVCRSHPALEVLRRDIAQRQRRLLQRAAVMVGAFGDLDGILYSMYIRDMTQFGYTEELFPGEDLQDE